MYPSTISIYCVLYDTVPQFNFNLMTQFSEGKGYQGNRTIKNWSIKIQEATSNVFSYWEKKDFSDKSYIPTRSIYLQKLTLIMTLQMNRYSSIRCPSCKNYSCWWLQMIKQMTASKCWFEYWIYFFATNFVCSFSF